MKFTSNGIARKDGYRFEIHFANYLDGQMMAEPYYLYCCRPTKDNAYNEGVHTERTLRFLTEEDAKAFCEKILSGDVTLDQLRAAEHKAVVEYLENQRARATEAVDTFMATLDKLGVNPLAVPEVVKEYQKMHNVLAYSHDSSELFTQRLNLLKENPAPKRHKQTLAEHMELTREDIDVLLEDKDTGEHLLPAVCYVPEHRRNDPEIGYEPWENWVRDLPLERIIDNNGCPLAVVKTDFSLDQTCFLLGENAFVSNEWIGLYDRSVWAGAEFQDRLDFLKTGKAFERTFDGTCMDAQETADRSKICEMLLDRNQVFIATYPSDESQYYVYSYQFDKNGRPQYDFNEEIDIKHTQLGHGLTSSLEGKVCWAQHAGNKAREEALKQAEQAKVTAAKER